MTTVNRRSAALIPAVIICLSLAGCSNSTATPPEQEPSMSKTDSSEAKRAWGEADDQAEAIQAIVPGRWLSTDSAADSCGDAGVQWGLSRIGPGISEQDRGDKVASVEEKWRSFGWKPTRSELTGDSTGTQIRYPASGFLDNGFFAEFATTENASTLQIQTPCTPGDVDQLNREKYAEKHTNTPPDIPGASDPSASATS